MIPGVPYDAEIEYLESTGTQYIDTGVQITSTDNARFVVDCTITNTIKNTSVFVGSGVTAIGALHYVMELSGSSYYIRTGGGTASAHIPYIRGQRVLIDTYYDSQHRRVVKVGNEMYQGSAYNANTGTLLILLGTSNAVWQKQEGKLYSVQVYIDNIIIRDFIPVRVGQTGYMYDRVTRRLFGNKGTGSFVLGPDVAKPVIGLYGMRKFYSTTDYIQEGLVALFDGIENAGWGVHDNTTQTWIDLMGNELPITPNFGGSNGFYWTETGVYNFVYRAQQASSVSRDYSANGVTLEIVSEGGVFRGHNNFYQDSFIKCGGIQSNNYYLFGSFGQNSNAIYAANIYNISGKSKSMSMVIATSGDGNVFFNGSYTGAMNASAKTLLLSGSGRIAIGNNNGNYHHQIFNSIRLYSRALSADEIAHNYAIDKARFNLP